jgi:hypothetical protein
MNPDPVTASVARQSMLPEAMDRFALLAMTTFYRINLSLL